jgi:hypothetical protein
MESRSILFFCHSIVRRGLTYAGVYVSLRGPVCLQRLEATEMEGEGLLGHASADASSLPSSSRKQNKREPRSGRVPSGSDQPTRPSRPCR